MKSSYTCISLNSRLESNKEEEEEGSDALRCSAGSSISTSNWSRVFTWRWGVGDEMLGVGVQCQYAALFGIRRTILNTLNYSEYAQLFGIRGTPTTVQV